MSLLWTFLIVAMAAEPTPPERVSMSAPLLSPTGDVDHDVLLGMRASPFLPTPDERLEQLEAIRRAEITDPNIAHLRTTWLAAMEIGVRVGEVGFDGPAERQLPALLSIIKKLEKAIKKRRLEREQEAFALELIEQLSTAPRTGPAYGISACHPMEDDVILRRPAPLQPTALQAPPGHTETSKAAVLIAIDETGASSWVGILEGDDAHARACFSHVSGPWRPPSNAITDEKARYCWLHRCRF